MRGLRTAGLSPLPISPSFKSMGARRPLPLLPPTGDPASISSSAPGNNLRSWQSVFSADESFASKEVCSPETLVSTAGNVGTWSSLLVSHGRLMRKPRKKEINLCHPTGRHVTDVCSSPLHFSSSILWFLTEEPELIKSGTAFRWTLERLINGNLRLLKDGCGSS